MVSVLMIPRSLRQARRGWFSLLVLLSVLSFVAASCNKVPLLAPTGSTITLTSAATALPANGSTTIIAQVLEASGTPPQDGTLITFTTTLGSIQPPQAETNGGRVTVNFNSGTQSGTATITASSGGATVGATGAIKIAVGAAAVSGITIAATPTVVPSTGGTSTITATAGDAGGNPLNGVQISFTTDVGSVSPAVATTDANGRAQAALTTSKTAKVTATAGVTTSTTGTGGTTTTTAPPSATITVTVNTTQAITAGTPTPATPTVGQTVSIPLTYPTATGATPVAHVTVNWGDGSGVQTYSGQPGAVTHSYGAAGSYLVQVSGVDSFGDTSTTSTSVTVGPKPRVVVTLTAPGTAPTPNVAATFTISATASGTGNAITSMIVNWDDGTSSPITGNATSVSHIFTAAGTYTVTVTATDSAGATGSASTIVVVGGSGATARVVVAVTPPTAPTPNLPAIFTIAATASGTGNVITSMSVSWGDGTSSPVTGNATSASHIFTAAGTYTVTVTATDSAGATGSASTVVVVGGGLVAKFTFSPTSPAPGQQVSFNASDSTLTGTVTTYAWDFGDGDAPSRTVPTISHAFAVAGAYKVRLTITQSNGQTATTTNDVTVK